MDCMTSSGKGKGGGVCFLINTLWCSDMVTLASHCTLDLEYLTVKCHPYYLLREFTSAILSAVYIPPHADVKSVLDEIYTTPNTLEPKFPKALFLVASDFNQANLKEALSMYHQHISCPTRGPNILDHCYATIKDAYRSIPCPHFGKSDHSAVFLLPACKQKLKRGSLHGKKFGASPRQQKNISREIHSLLKTRRETFKLEDPALYIKSRFDLRKAIRDAKRQYQTSSVVTPALDTPVPTVTAADIRSVLLGVNPRKVMGQDGLPAVHLDLVQTSWQRSTMDAISLALHSSLEHMDNKDTYVRLLLIDYSSTFSKERRRTYSHYITGSEAKSVESIKFLGVTITDNLSWASHVDATVKKAQQRLFFP
eukprot:g38615.t1